MKKIQKLTAIVMAVIATVSGFAQDNYVKIAAQYRLRPELRNGYRTLVTDTSRPAFFAGQRARLTFDYKQNNIQLYTSIQDARTWGDEVQGKELQGLQVNELWLEIRLNKALALKMGRQELVYDDQRLLGNLDWANVTISHDALLLKYNNYNSSFKWHLGGAFNQVGEPVSGTFYPLNNYKALGFTWMKKTFNKGHALSATAVVNGMNSTVHDAPRMKATYTVGPLYSYNANGWAGYAGIYYQGGKIAVGLQQSAFMLNAYGAKNIRKITVGLGFDYLSGNGKNTAANRSQSFSTLYATNHKFYGYMDYFLNIPADAKQLGLTDLYARLSYRHTKQLSATLDIHRLALANESVQGAYVIKKPLGIEPDLLVDYFPSQIMHLQIGYSLLFANKNMEYIKGGNSNGFNTWAYVMLKVSPTLLIHELHQ